jgi:demethylmenaquinone methyltransferase/2-methoxy-6-polyprenyl-1,4-benzoquinol methylase
MTTYNKNNPETIQAMFGCIAKKYDRQNAILSFQMHKRWNRELIKQATIEKPKVLLDLCCGTGDIALAYLKDETLPKQAILLDFCPEMLACAKEKADRLAGNHQITFLQADAQQIPLKDASIPCATMAYGIRNIKDPLLCLHEVYRVLEPGGSFGILELTRPANPLLRLGHQLYLKTVLPLFGEAYTYLCNSIHAFIPPATLKNYMLEAGFRNIQQTSLTGGIATLLVGRKDN